MIRTRSTRERNMLGFCNWIHLFFDKEDGNGQEVDYKEVKVKMVDFRKISLNIFEGGLVQCAM